ncbi:ABC transporter ATP-binding protein [Leucobacter soli]|nr:ATP-binding cassette domain-containing protein [Leucobacter soli]
MAVDPDAVDAAGSDVVVRLNGITKRFPGVTANYAISLELRRGAVHCLLGENGSGKSTLIGIFAGLQQPDEGAIEIDGSPVVLRSPAAAIERGIGVVHQHSVLIPTMSAVENLLLGERGSLRLDRRGAESRLAELSETLGVPIDPNAPVGELGLGARQQLEIALALRSGSRVLVLDEPTSLLPPQAIEALLGRLRRLAEEGYAVLFVTHKLQEARRVADAVTVLRRGRVVTRLGSAELAEPEESRIAARLLGAMFGDGTATTDVPARASAQASASTQAPSGALAPGVETPSSGAAPAVLEVVGLGTTSGGGAGGGHDGGGVPLSDVSFRIASGEVLGVAGIDGHGQGHLGEAIAGQRRCTVGSIRLDGRRIEQLRVRERRRLGVRYVTDDRLYEGIVGSLGVAVNLMLKQIGERPFWRWGRMDRAAVRRRAQAQIEEYGIRTPSPDTRAGTLSGGNIQKLLLARELADDPRVVVFNKPTHGLDLESVGRVRGILRDFADRGGAALLISSDLDELVELCDRILVMSGGRIVGEVPVDGREGGAAESIAESTAERVGALIVGARTDPSGDERAEAGA